MKILSVRNLISINKAIQQETVFNCSSSLTNVLDLIKDTIMVLIWDFGE